MSLPRILKCLFIQNFTAWGHRAWGKLSMCSQDMVIHPLLYNKPFHLPFEVRAEFFASVVLVPEYGAPKQSTFTREITSISLKGCSTLNHRLLSVLTYEKLTMGSSRQQKKLYALGK